MGGGFQSDIATAIDAFGARRTIKGNERTTTWRHPHLNTFRLPLFSFFFDRQCLAEYHPMQPIVSGFSGTEDVNLLFQSGRVQCKRYMGADITTV
jgi:hypothetical protein